MTFSRSFFPWYNTEHYQEGISMLPPRGGPLQSRSEEFSVNRAPAHGSDRSWCGRAGNSSRNLPCIARSRSPSRSSSSASTSGQSWMSKPSQSPDWSEPPAPSPTPRTPPSPTGPASSPPRSSPDSVDR